MKSLLPLPPPLYRRERRRVELGLGSLDLGQDPVDVALHGLDLGLDAGDLRFCGLDPLLRFGDLAVERRDLRFELLARRGDRLQLLDRGDLLGRRILDRIRQLVAAGPRIRRRLTACDGGRDEAEQERARDEAEKEAMGLQGSQRTQHESH